ncbi:hypothetical protein VTG60DRAFT_1960 [Thermothelomyces hinnuleus]
MGPSAAILPRALFTNFLLLPSLLFASPTSALRDSSCGVVNTPRYCRGTDYNESLVNTYLCGDRRLGPTQLPSAWEEFTAAPVLAAIVFGYDRFGGLCPGKFLKRWTDENGRYEYPEETQGFLPSGDGTGPLIWGNVTLPVGTLMDRFGAEGGNYTSPAGTPYALRALPPSNLDETTSEYPYNYHVYSVVKPLTVLAGPIQPWFEQPGTGVQYELYSDVSVLIKDGYLRREDPSVLLP